MKLARETGNFLCNLCTYFCMICFLLRTSHNFYANLHEDMQPDQLGREKYIQYIFTNMFSCRICTKILFQVSETVAFCCWSDFSKKHKIFKKHALIDSLKALLLMTFADKHHNVGCYTDTIHKLICVMIVYPYFSFRAPSPSMSWSPLSIALSVMTSHMPIFLNCIHPFIFFNSFFHSNLFSE